MTLGQRSPALGRAEPFGRGSVRAGSVQAVPSTQDPDGATRSDSSTAAGDGEASGDGPGGSPGPEAAPPGRTGRCDARCTTTAGDPVTPFRQPDQHTAGTQVSNSNSDNAQNTDNGDSDTDNGNNAGGNGQGKQAGVEKGSDKKKTTDA